MNHLDDDVLSAYSHDGTAAEEVEAHVKECEICRDGLAVFREIDRALRGRETWTTVDQARSQNSRLQEVLWIRRRIEAEERGARHALSLLNEALAKGRATPELLRGVRSYLERLPFHPDESFQFVP